MLVVVDGLGHHWAGGDPGAMPERLVGPYSDRIDAPSLIWTFFGRHRRP